jgi:membrane protein YqaA with SNARE-associated domain
VSGSLQLSRGSLGVFHLFIKKFHESTFLSAGSEVKALAELPGMNREQELI